MTFCQRQSPETIELRTFTANLRLVGLSERYALQILAGLCTCISTSVYPNTMSSWYGYIYFAVYDCTVFWPWQELHEGIGDMAVG